MTDHAENEAVARPLTDKEARFVEEYLIDLDAPRAAVAAGYSPNRRQTAYELLARPEVQAEIARGKRERSRRTRIRQDRVLRELAALAFSDIGEVLDFAGAAVRLRAPKDIPVSARRALASVKVKRYPERAGTDADGKPLMETCEVLEFKLYDKGAALERAMRHLGMLKDGAGDEDPTRRRGGVVLLPDLELEPEYTPLVVEQHLHLHQAPGNGHGTIGPIARALGMEDPPAP